MQKIYESKPFLCDADLGHVQQGGHPRKFFQPIEKGGGEAMLPVVKGELARLTHDIMTLRMERIPIDMKEHVVGVPPSLLHLLRKVSRTVLCYREVVAEASAESTYFFSI